MAFTIIKAETRTARMVQWFTGICTSVTDLVIGSKLRSKFESVAVELEEQDYQFYAALKKAIPTAIYQAFNFNLLQATKASGTATFTANPAPASPITIPAGTRIATVATTSVAEKVYETTGEAIILAGQTTASATASCTAQGTVGNTGAGTVTVIKTTIPGVTAVTNAQSFANGEERETESARRGRFLTYITNLARATADAVSYGAKTAQLVDGNGVITERVVYANTVDTATAGQARCIIHDGANGASASLIAEAQKIIDGYTNADGVKVPGYKAAGVVVTVEAATSTATNVTATLTLYDSSIAGTTIAQVEAVVDAYFQTMTVGGAFVKAQLVGRIMTVSNVENVSISAPAADLPEVVDAIYTKGVVTVSEAP